MRNPGSIAVLDHKRQVAHWYVVSRDDVAPFCKDRRLLNVL